MKPTVRASSSQRYVAGDSASKIQLAAARIAMPTAIAAIMPLIAELRRTAG